VQLETTLSQPQPPNSAGRIALALSVTLALVFGAWLIGGRQGFESIGNGGKNARPLPRIGEVAPNLQAYNLVAIDGAFQMQVVSLSDFAGQPVWLNFWGSWCQPCRAEMPDLIEAYRQLEGSGIVMLAISLDEDALTAVSYAAQSNANFRVLSDENRQLTGSNYQINNFPTHIFIDSFGVVRDVQLAPLSVEAALAAADKAINPAADAS
jgi:thiol-disulfide isomerase/thioredoxin